MARPSANSSNNNSPRSNSRASRTDRRRKRRGQEPPKWWKLWLFVAFLGFDIVTSLLLLTPWIPPIEKAEDLSASSVWHYSLHGVLWDLALVAVFRVSSALVALIVSYHRREAPPESPFDLYHKNGDKKSQTELEEEALEEPYLKQFQRYLARWSVLHEVAVFGTGILLALKCMARLNVEIGVLHAEPRHPVFWLALAATGFWSLLQSSYMEATEKLAGDLGRQRRQTLLEQNGQNGSFSWLERVSGSLAQPLLSSSSRVNSEADLQQQQAGEVDEEMATTNRSSASEVRGVSEIGPDANYTASSSDLLRVCEPDKHLILLACVFLLAAAVAQVYIPKYTGAVLDALVGGGNATDASNEQPLFLGNLYSLRNTTTMDDDDATGHYDYPTLIPGFLKNIEMLLFVSILGGVFAGIRGAIFTMVGARVNTRLRILLMDSLLSQEIGFYDTTRTGDITSRLSSDTSVVGGSITSNVNIFLRSSVRAIGVLIFMFTISWQLSLLAFITIPAVSILSKWYGRYIRRLAKLQQKKLADGNSVSESTVSSIATVRAFGAENVELTEFEECMKNYLRLNAKAAVATLGYSTIVGALPQLVNALVLYYGGLLVQSDGPDHISGGQLVSFILYLSSLAEAFNSLGGIYASIVRLIGAADKVMELMNRESKLTTPTHLDEERLAKAIQNKPKHVLSVESTKVLEQRVRGLYPEQCVGEVSFQDVEFRYPARPQRPVLDSMNLTIPAGSVVALTGTSGGGKSSIMRLIQHLYEPAGGNVCIDNVPVQELSADWLCRNVSVVSQEPVLFARSVRRNIIYGLEGTDQEPSQADVEEAARLANASEFIEALPEQYETEIGERGVTLSGGQKQRIAIARALVRKPRVLLLDEATSALDAESEHVVQKAIDDMISGQRSLDGDPSRSMTVIIVAHRLSTVRNSDCIFVIKDGNVAEAGSHDELMGQEDGVYYGLVKRQLGQA